MLAQKLPEVTLYENISNEEYHAIPGLSATGVKLLLDCPKKYKMAYIDGKRKERKHFEIGKLIHTILLEPNTFSSRYFVLQHGEKRTEKKLSEIKEVHGGIEVINASTLEEARNQSYALSEHPIMRELLNKKLNIEHSIVYYDSELGVTLKTRPDIYTENIVVDIKSTNSVNPNDFSRSVYEYGYHRQACLALDGLQALTGRKYNSFILLAVEKEPPYCVEAYVLVRDNGQRLRYDAIAHGRRDIARAASIYKKCIETNTWPSYTEKLVEINLPYWAQTEVL